MKRATIWRNLWPPLVTFVVVVGLWQTLVSLLAVKAYVFPSPVMVWQQAMHYRATLVQAMAQTAEASIGGLLVGSAAGFFIGTMFAQVPFLRKSLYPYAIALQTTPILAIAPLIILWVGSGLLSRVLIAAIIAMFPVIVNTTLGMTAVNPLAVDLMRLYGASRSKEFRWLRFPNSLPYTLSALKVSATLAVIGALVAEFVTGNAGLGFVIIEASSQMETPYLFAAIILAALLGLLLFTIVEGVSYLLLRTWHDTHRVQS